MAAASAFSGQPASQLTRTVLEQLAIGVDAIRSGREGAAAEFRIIVLPDGECRPAGDPGAGDGLDAVVSACGQIDDDPVDVG